MYAGIALGIYESCRDAVKKAVTVSKVFYPDEGKAEEYQRVFDKWKNAYETLKDGFYWS